MTYFDVQAEIVHADCRNELPCIPSASVDFVFADPPYPCINRKGYPMLQVDKWWELMVPVVEQCKRILKPTGSAVFILQPNSEHVGQMRPWLWEFIAWAANEWNLVQDVYWWNTNTLPSIHSTQYGLLRNSMKYCIWLGEPACYSNQQAVLWDASCRTKLENYLQRQHGVRSHPSGHITNRDALISTHASRGGVAPFNIILCGGAKNRSASEGHGATTPRIVVDWWIRYCVPANGIVVDPFFGYGTTGQVAVKHGHTVLGIEKEDHIYDEACARMEEWEYDATN